MAENEIVKHVQAAYKAVNNPGTNWLHKLKEVLIEILIIVFAVSLSIWFHNWSDRLHEHKEEKEYLLGLKKDLQADFESAGNDKAFYENTLAGLNYFQRVAVGEPLNPDSFKQYQGVFFSNTSLEPHISRYEGLKGSGKLGIIENNDLLNNIINFHEGTVKHTELLDNYYTEFANRIGYFLQEHAELATNGTVPNIQEVLRMTQIRFMYIYGATLISHNIIRYHDSCIVQCRQIIHQINTELNLPDSTQP